MRLLIILIIMFSLIGCGTESHEDPANYINCDKEKYAEWFISCVDNKDSRLTPYGCEIYGKKMYCEYQPEK